jgi:YaiO family outer membrane protein
MQLLVRHAFHNVNTCAKPTVLTHLFLFIALSSICNSVYTQNTDQQFKQAQAMAAASKYDSAIVILTKICTTEPKNMDMRLYRARVHAWSKNFDAAEADARFVLDKQPNNREVLALMGDVYLWSQQWDNLEHLAQNALKTAPKNVTQQEGLMDSILFTKKYVHGLIEQTRFRDAAKALFPVKDYLFSLWDFVQSKLNVHTIAIHETYYNFEKGQKDWAITNVEYTQKLKKVALVGSINHANRFGKSGNQLMVQAYPNISKRAYMWLLAGFADGKTHPNLVYGGSFYLYPHKLVEVEGGIRTFKVKDFESATILRGGLVYQKNKNRIGYTLMQVRGASITGLTHNLLFQRYFDKHDSYWRASIGTGTNANIALLPQFDNFIINSISTNISTYYYLHRNWRLLGGISLEKNKNQNSGLAQSRWIFDLGLAYKF